MPATYEPIATVNGTGSSSVITFSSIPSTYTDLVLVCYTIGSNASVTDFGIRFNSDTGNNYSRTILYGTGSSAGSARSSNISQVYMDYYGGLGTSTYPGVQIAHIMNYSNTTTYKTVLIRSNNANSGVDALVSMWRSTSAINRIDTVVDSGANMQTTAMFTLYGIKAA